MFGKKKRKNYVNVFDQEPETPASDISSEKKDPDKSPDNEKAKEDQNAGEEKEDKRIKQNQDSKETNKEEKKPDKKEKDNKNDGKIEESSIKEVFSRVIEPEERTFKNYINPRFWLDKTDKFLKLRKKEQNDLNVYAVLSAGARPTADYYILTILSCLIATAGLIQGSTAAIIGAMIVAPLMTPILAFSLAVVWGEVTLLRVSLASILKGGFWAVFISAFLAYIVPISEYSTEIISRTTPTFYDILIAIASGVVGAYGYTNKNISNTIVGIAIAVALMPPLCTIGIGLGTMNTGIAYGATLLFSINLVAISLAGAVIFWIMKVHPISAEKGDVIKRAMSQIVISVIVLVIISVPVGFFMYEGYEYSETKKQLYKTINDMKEYNVFSMDREKTPKGMIIKLVITGSEEPGERKKKFFKKITEDLTRKHPMVADVDIRFIKSLEIK